METHRTGHWIGGFTTAQKNDPLGDILAGMIKGIGTGLKSALRGARRLTRPIPLIGFIVSLGLFALVQWKRNFILTDFLNLEIPLPIRYLIFWALLLIPLFYLMALGAVGDRRAKKYIEIFKEIGFVGKDKKYPYLISEKVDDKRTIYMFRSNIPLIEWKKAKERIETGLDCSIRQLREGGNKKLVELVAVSSDYQIPTLINWNDEYIQKSDGVLCIGESDLQKVCFDLNKTPHVLAAGETGSGKSVILRCILWQMINKGSRIYMIDFKGGVEFGKAYEKFGEVITNRDRALEVLEKLVKENEVRLKLFREMEVKNLKEYNDVTNSNLCRVGVFIDEIAEMLDKKGVSKEEKAIFEKLEAALSTLARLSRATGINLFLGVQRPDANILTGQIKNNVPVRICGRFADKAASEIVLGNTDAIGLPDTKGRFLFRLGNETIEFQSFWFDDSRDLHDVTVESGDMLSEEKKYTPKKQEDDSEQPEVSEFKLDLDFSHLPGIEE